MIYIIGVIHAINLILFSSFHQKSNTMNFEEEFLKDITKRFQSYKTLGDKTFEQLSEKDFFYQSSHESNSIAIIIKHVHGNLLSRFTNFLTEDGEKPWRKRDEEFEQTKVSKEEILSLWNEGWNKLLNTIKSLYPDDVMTKVSIRNEQMYAYDALLRALAHVAYHVGQIVYLGKEIKDAAWETLSIPKRQSKQFNERSSPLK
jgi:hypothetical protein